MVYTVGTTRRNKSLTLSPEERTRLGRAARVYAEKNLARDAVLGQFEQQLVALHKGTRS